MPDSPVLLGIDLGGTKIRTIAFDEALSPLNEDYRETGAEDGPDAVIARMIASGLAAAAGRPARAAGISTPGPSKPAEGIVTEPPNLPGWRDVPLARLISEQLGVPAWIENDANAAALAEFRRGAGRGLRHMVQIALGTGIGGGLIVGGRLVHGASGGAGELGHMLVQPGGPVCGCGRRGCLEAMASGVALAREAGAIIGRNPGGILARLASGSGEESDARVLHEAAEAGDAEADAAIRAAGRYLGDGLVNLVNLLNPELIVLSGSLRRLGGRYLDEAFAVLKRDAFAQHYADVRVVEAQLGDEAPCVGAAIIAGERLAAS